MRRRDGRVSRTPKWVKGQSCHFLQLGRAGLRGEIRSIVLDYYASEARWASKQRCWGGLRIWRVWDSDEARTKYLNLEVISDRWYPMLQAWMRAPRAWVKRERGFSKIRRSERRAGPCKGVWEGSAYEVGDPEVRDLLEAKWGKCSWKGGMIKHGLVLALLVRVSGHLGEKMMCFRTHMVSIRKCQVEISPRLVIQRKRQDAERQSDVMTSRWIRNSLTNDTQGHT